MVRASCAWLAPLLCACVGSASAAPHTVKELVRPSLVRDVALSPDGKRVAIGYRIGETDETGRDVVVICEADRLGEPGSTNGIPLGEDRRVTVNWLAWATTITAYLTSLFPA